MYLEGVGEGKGKMYDPVSIYKILKNNKNFKKSKI